MSKIGRDILRCLINPRLKMTVQEKKKCNKITLYLDKDNKVGRITNETIQYYNTPSGVIIPKIGKHIAEVSDGLIYVEEGGDSVAFYTSDGLICVLGYVKKLHTQKVDRYKNSPSKELKAEIQLLVDIHKALLRREWR